MESASQLTSTKFPDKLNGVDFRWFIVRTLPHQERLLAGLLRRLQSDMPNILEVYCPTHTTVSVMRGGRDVPSPLFAGYVFVLSTRQALSDFLARYYPSGRVMLNRKGSGDGDACSPRTVPEPQMRAFMDFNENYASHVIILERPYSDYAFNPKTSEPNEVVRVLDGPLAGREGYLVRFRRDRRVVFNMVVPGSDRRFTVSVPHAWDFHVVRLHNAEGDRLSSATVKERAADLLLGMLQRHGYGESCLPMLHSIVRFLASKSTLVGLCQSLYRQGHEDLSRDVARVGVDEARMLLELARYEREHPGYMAAHWNSLVIRPFLTPTAGVEPVDGSGESLLRHGDFTESIRRVEIDERAYYPSEERSRVIRSTYYAHVGVLSEGDGRGTVLFTNWDSFLDRYFHTSGRANERLVEGSFKHEGRSLETHDEVERTVESFRSFAPTLHKVLTDDTSPVRVLRDLKVGDRSINVIATRVGQDDTARVEEAKGLLVSTCVRICEEINTTTHLAVWRRYLRTVWLHR